MADVKVGESVLAEAEFLAANGQPMVATGTTLRVRAPDGTVRTLALAPDAARPTTFVATFTPDAPGTWQAEGHCTGPTGNYTPTRFLRVDPRPF